MADKAKRGRLSAIDTLPEWADEAKVWAFEQLKERKLSQLEILDGFNGRLKVAALSNGETDPPVISRSAFNRTALRVALLSRRLEDTRQIASVIAPKLEEAGDESLTLMVAETLKTLIAEMLGNAGELSADGDTAMMLMATARALKHAEEAKRIGADGRRKYESDLKSKAVKAVDMVAKEKGLSDEAANAIKAKVLGIRPKQEARP